MNIKKTAQSTKPIKRRLHVEAGKARPTPPLGPALSELKVNIKVFCDDFNNATKNMSGTLPVDIFVKPGGKYTYKLHKETSSSLIKNHFKIKKGSQSPNREEFMEVEFEDFREIAEYKKEDLCALDTEAAMHTLAGSARSMGIVVRNMK